MVSAVACLQNMPSSSFELRLFDVVVTHSISVYHTPLICAPSHHRRALRGEHYSIASTGVAKKKRSPYSKSLVRSQQLQRDSVAVKRGTRALGLGMIRSTRHVAGESFGYSTSQVSLLHETIFSDLDLRVGSSIERMLLVKSRRPPPRSIFM